MDLEAKKLIVKYLTQQITSVELDVLSVWLENPENERVFYNFIRINYAIEYSMIKFDKETPKKKLLALIEKDKKNKNWAIIRNISKYAAVIVLFVVGGYYLQHYFEQPQLIIKEDNITLKLESGNIEILNDKENTQLLNSNGVVIAEQNGNRLNYTGNTNNDKLEYNELKVPNGKRFELNLSDGTKIYLNSGTSIKYPIKFLSGLDRQVFIKGEAFFDVSKNLKNPFIVNAQELNVRVLGTHFNVSAYPEDNATDVVLVEGSVGMYSDNKDLSNDDLVILKPGSMGIFSKSNHQTEIKQVKTSVYTSWVEGVVVFRKVSFENIMTKLERYYNVTIIINNEKLANENFNASIDIDNESIQQVLDYFDKVYQIKYEIVNNKIVIN